MTKNLKLNFILSIVFVSIILAWTTLMRFFEGVGINFVALFLIMSTLTFIVISDKFVRSRWMDVFCLLAILFVMEMPVYFAIEFSKEMTIKTALGWMTYQNVISVITFFVTIYMMFRLFLEIKNIRFKFIEVILGNEKFSRAPKRAKELSNGALEDKPGTINQSSVEIASEEDKEPVNTIVENQENSEQ